MNQRLATIVVAASTLLISTTLLSCTTSDGASTASDLPAIAPPSASDYTFELTNLGSGERYELIAPVPVGRTADVTVSLTSLDETVDVSLEANVVQAGADGQSQLIELIVVGIVADDASTVDGLSSIVGASASLVRDGRLSIVEQQLNVPAGLTFRADAVVRQALRAPFVLVGPLALQPVGAGATWTIETSEDGTIIDSTDVEVISNSADGFQLRFEVPDGVAEITGRPGALLPDEQLITLDNATLRVVAERTN